MKKIFLLLSITIILIGCAEDKELTLNGRTEIFETYGWADYDELKNDSIYYKVCVGNVVWSVIGVETIIAPIWLTGWDLYEPIRVKPQFVKSFNKHNDTIPKFIIVR